MQRHIGIDPGVSGGIAWIDADGPHAEKMPATIGDLWQLIAGLEASECYCVIEKVHTSPQMGVKSAGTFMQGKGQLLMALCAGGIPNEQVSPHKWQRTMGLLSGKGKNKTDHKNKLKAKAQELFPALKITHATADALLLAEYCRRYR